MYSFISPENKVVKTKSIADFARTYGFRYSNAKSLACGHYKSLKGWFSTHRKAAKRRQRHFTVLVNPSGERKVLGGPVTAFARRHNLATDGLYKLLNGKKIGHNGWVLQRTYDAALGETPAGCF
jgi:hypothetical protein